MKNALAAVVIIGGLCSSSGASGRVVVRSSAYTYYQPPAIAFQAVPLPIYHVAYGSAQQADPAILERIAAAQERQAAALERIAGRGPNGELADLPPEPEYVGLVRQNCASCHGINPKGNKLSFFHPDGRFKDMTPDVLGNVIAAVSSGAMPKGQKMEAADRLKLIAGLTSAPEAAAKMPPGK